MINWYENYLTHRNLITEINGANYTASNGIGFPQSGVVSANFWKIVFDPEINIINNKDTWSEWRLTVISATGRVEMGIVLGLYCSLEAADHSQKSAPKGTCRPM